MNKGYIVTVSNGSFRDTIVSRKNTLAAAVKDGLRWYRQAARDPRLRPSVEASPVMIM